MDPKQLKQILETIKNGRFILLDFKIALQLLKQCGTGIKIYIKIQWHTIKRQGLKKCNFVNCSKIMKCGKNK